MLNYGYLKCLTSYWGTLDFVVLMWSTLELLLIGICASAAISDQVESNTIIATTLSSYKGSFANQVIALLIESNRNECKYNLSLNTKMEGRNVMAIYDKSTIQNTFIFVSKFYFIAFYQ